MEDSFFEVVLDVVTTPLRGGGPTVSPWEIVVTLFSVVFRIQLCKLFLLECQARYWPIMRDKYEIFTEIHSRYGRYMRDIQAGYTFESTYGCTGLRVGM